MSPEMYGQLFGQVVKTERLNRGLTYIELSRRVDNSISHTSISRLEKNQISFVLDTSIKVVDALQLTPQNLYEQIFKKEPVVTEFEKEGFYPNREDIDRLELFGQKERLVTGEFLSTWLNKVYSAFWQPEHLRRYGHVKVDKPVAGAGDPYLTEPYLPTDIYKIVLKEAPFSLTPHYPDALEGDDIRNIYSQNGVILFQDIQVYLEYIYEKGKVVREDPAEISNPLIANIKSIREKITQTRSIRNIKLSEVLKMDEFFNCRGEMLFIFWKCASDEMRYQNFVNNPLGLALIMISRWITNYGLAGKEWIEDLRRIMN